MLADVQFIRIKPNKAISLSLSLFFCKDLAVNNNCVVLGYNSSCMKTRLLTGTDQE